MGRFKLPTSYEEAGKFLRGAYKRKAAHNTFVRNVLDGYAVRYHKTDVVTFCADGRVIVNTNGWDTATTRERLRSCGISCGTQDGVTSITHGAFEWLLRDDMTLYPNGTVSGSYPDKPEVVRARIRAAAGKARREKAKRERAIRARRSGNFTDRALLAFGPLSTDTEADCRAIARGQRLTGGL